MNNKERLDEVSLKIKECIHGQLWKNRLKAIPGEEPSDANILFIGEAHEEKITQIRMQIYLLIVIGFIFYVGVRFILEVIH